MKPFLKRGNHPVFRNMAILATSAGISKIIGLISIPIITRIYTPEQFGILSLFIATTMILMPFSTMSYPMSIPLPKRDELAKGLAFVSTLILISVVTAISLILYFFSPTLFQLFDLGAFIRYWWLIPVSTAFLGLLEIYKHLAIRKKDFRSIFASQISQSITDPVTKIGLGLLGVKSFGLLLGIVIAQAVGATILIRRSRTFWRNVDVSASRKKLYFLLQYYSQYPKFRLPSQFLLVFSKQSILIFSALYFGKSTAGQLGLAFITIGLPLQLFGETTGKAYYAEIAKLGRNKSEEIYDLTIQVIKRLFIFSLIPFLALAVGSPFLFQFAFGDKWQEAGIFTSILSINMLAAFVSAPIANALNVFNKQNIYLKLNAIRVLIITCLYCIIWFFEFNPYQSTLSYSIMLSLYFAWMTRYILQVIKNNFKVNK